MDFLTVWMLGVQDRGAGRVGSLGGFSPWLTDMSFPFVLMQSPSAQVFLTSLPVRTLVKIGLGPRVTALCPNYLFQGLVSKSRRIPRTLLGIRPSTYELARDIIQPRT